MTAVFIILHVIVSILLVVAILVQSSKGGGLAGSAFGGGPSMSFLGARGTATFLSRATTILAIIFMLNSLALSKFRGGKGPISVTQESVRSTSIPNVPLPQGSQGGEEEGASGPQQGGPQQPGQSGGAPPADQQSTPQL